MDVLTDDEINSLTSKSKLAAKYNQVVDSESAYEILTAKLQEAQAKSEEESPSKAESSSTKKEESFFDNPVVKQVGRTAATIITRSLLGALGLGGRTSRRRY
jgi:hypothetical protein